MHHIEGRSHASHHDEVMHHIEGRSHASRHDEFMLRMEGRSHASHGGSTDEGRAYGPRRDCAVPSRTVRQRTSAPPAFGMGGASLRAMEGGGG